MAQVFPPGSNWLAKWSIFGGAGAVVLFTAVASAVYWGPFTTRVNMYRPQPIPFSHQRHVQGNGIDCRYCHTTVENSSFAGIPATETCMTCHSQVLQDQPMIQIIHESWRNEVPLEWARVNDVPDFVYFNHSIHINQGVGCNYCHGPVDEMPLTYKAETLHMAWCIECHRAPEKFIRPREEVFNMDWEPGPNQEELGRQLVEEYNIQVGQLMNCSICHR